MAESNQYTMTLKEVAELIVKKIDVHEGSWSLLLGVQIGVGNFGPTPDQTFPGATVTIQQIGIQRVDPNSPVINPGSVVVNAAVVNPKPKPKTKAK